QTLQFNLIDAQGRIILFQNHEFTMGKQQVSFSTKDLSSGQYYIQIVKDNETLHVPIIKE
ncbi:MAG: T9SS type A sorting domain-containing protein, partial [Chitinophagales bacterium]|nr:T9SS type A sorting domain-containing protein [Chitinophagales bacterium]